MACNMVVIRNFATVRRASSVTALTNFLLRFLFEINLIQQFTCVTIEKWSR